MKDRINKFLINERKIYFSIVIVYCILAVEVMLVNIFGIGVSEWAFMIDPKSVNSIVVSIQITLMLYLVVTHKKNGYLLSIVLSAVNLIVLAVPLIFFGETETVATIIMQVIAVGLNTVVYTFASKLDKKEKELYKVAYIDLLTNIPNRNAFFEEIKSFTFKGNIDKKIAVVMIDLDNFKTINDTLGRELGDDVLVEIVTRWKFIMNEKDTLFRLEGDEFALVTEDYADDKALLKRIEEFNDCIKRKISMGSANFFVTASFGVALYPEDSVNADELIRYADIALFKAQSELSMGVVFFNKRMLNSIENDREIATVLRENIINGAFNLVFQPQFDAITKNLRGFETLLRMNDGNGRSVSPAKFIPLAEKNGSIIDIDKFVLNKAMEIFKDIVKGENGSNLIISVNISALHLLEADLVSDVKQALENNSFPAQNLEIEITESVCIESVNQAITVLNKIKELGVKIALDDFGTGYASLSYLKKLPIDLLKIDKSFIDEIDSGEESSDFVAAIISMGHLLKFRVISEGVEHEMQLDTLKKLNCDYIQGYLWGKPMDIDNAKELIEKVC